MASEPSAVYDQNPEHNVYNPYYYHQQALMMMQQQPSMMPQQTPMMPQQTPMMPQQPSMMPQQTLMMPQQTPMMHPQYCPPSDITEEQQSTPFNLNLYWLNYFHNLALHATTDPHIADKLQPSDSTCDPKDMKEKKPIPPGPNDYMIPTVVQEPCMVFNIGDEKYRKHYSLLKRHFDQQFENLLNPIISTFYWFAHEGIQITDLCIVKDTSIKDRKKEVALRIFARVPIYEKLPELSMFSNYCIICKAMN